MEPFVRHTGVAAPLDRVNVDTDQIIPKQFLKRIERTGFGQFLFFDWRFLEDGGPNPDFVLNQPGYAGASILVAGRKLRFRLVEGARPVGASRLRLHVRHRAELRRTSSTTTASRTASSPSPSPKRSWPG